MDFEQREDADGVRVSWNLLPKSKLQHQRNVVPMGVLYTPLNDKHNELDNKDTELENEQTSTALPKECLMLCRQCQAACSMYSGSGANWVCHFCGFNNRLASALPLAATVEYVMSTTSAAPTFLFVVDTSFDDVLDFIALKESLLLSLSLLPELSRVGLITFNKHIQIHSLLLSVPKSYIFNGEITYSSKTFESSLRLGTGTGDAAGVDSGMFLQPISHSEYQLLNIIENLLESSFKHSSFERSLRCTGSALNIATLLLKSLNIIGGHLLTFISGPTTFGFGKIVSSNLKDSLRSHHDLIKLNSSILSVQSLFLKAKKQYDDILKLLLSINGSCSLFIGSYNQIGLYEMNEIVSKTGGSIIMADSFNTSIFKQSFIKFFKKNHQSLDFGFNSTLEIRVASDLKISGLIGNATSLPPKKGLENLISQSIIGSGSTNFWKLCFVNPQSTYAIYFEKLDSSSDYTFIQFLFHYQHPNGDWRLKITTIPINIIQDSDLGLEQGFDQEAALVLVARNAINQLQPPINSKSNLMSPTNIIKALDKQLIDYCARFALYIPGNLASFTLSQSYAMFPQFIYHLRRSPFINVFGNSPDESAYIRHVFMHEELTSSLIMIQPTLLCYDINSESQEPVPVLLDSISLAPLKILLLDTFFQVLIWHGEQVSQWRKAGYHEQPEYEHFKEFLESPKREAMEILLERFPLPRFIDCDEGGSQARFLMAKLNPSTSYANPAHRHVLGHAADVFTDDTSIQLFMDKIQKIIISRK